MGSQGKGKLNCFKCKKEIDKKSQGGIACSHCHRKFHASCVKMKCSDLVKFTNSAWYCTDCRSMDFLKDQVFIPTDKQPLRETAVSGVKSASDSNLLNRISKIESSLIDIRNRLATLESSHEAFSGEFSADLQKIKKDFANIGSNIPDDPPSHREIIVSNIPEFKNEKTLEVARHVLRKLDPSFNVTDVTKAHRFQAKNGPNYIKATLRTAKKKDSIIVKSRQKKLKVQDLELPSNAKLLTGSKTAQFKNPVQASRVFEGSVAYVNESVCKLTRQIFVRALQLKLENKVMAAWTWRNKAYVRVSEDADAVRCDTLECLEDLVIPATV